MMSLRICEIAGEEKSVKYVTENPIIFTEAIIIPAAIWIFLLVFYR